MKAIGVFRFRSSHCPVSMLKYSETAGISNSCFLAVRLTMLANFCADDYFYRLIRRIHCKASQYWHLFPCKTVSVSLSNGLIMVSILNHLRVLENQHFIARGQR